MAAHGLRMGVHLLHRCRHGLLLDLGLKVFPFSPRSSSTRPGSAFRASSPSSLECRTPSVTLPHSLRRGGGGRGVSPFVLSARPLSLGLACALSTRSRARRRPIFSNRGREFRVIRLERKACKGGRRRRLPNRGLERGKREASLCTAAANGGGGEVCSRSRRAPQLAS